MIQIGKKDSEKCKNRWETDADNKYLERKNTMRKSISYKIVSCVLAAAMTFCIAVPSNVHAAKKKKVSLSVKTVILKAGKTKKLKVKGVSKKKIKKITWRTSNKKVAKVYKSGKVIALQSGKATIKCKVKLKTGKKYSLKCKVKVEEEIKEPNDNVVAPDYTVAPVPTTNPIVTTTVPVSSEIPSVSCSPEMPTPSPTPTEEQFPTPDCNTGAPVITEPPVVTESPISSTTPEEVHLSKNGIETIDDGVMRTDMTAFDMVHNMGVGINLGNTMESCGTWINSSSVTNYEKAWGAPVTTQEMITGMKEAGFNSIRIPVAWSNMMAEDGTYTINEAYFDRVETIMNYALNEKMYVIINIHFDGGWWARFGSTMESEREEAMKKYKTMWTQIANRYMEYSDYLIFESANEELGGRLNSTDDYAGSGYFTSESQLYELTNTINQTFVDIVRGTGGNNATRHLLIAGYNTDIGKTCNAQFEMPEDTVASRLMISVHYYSPPTYCLVAREDNSWGYSATWGTEEEIAAMESDLKNMKIAFVNKGYPVIIGEYGVCDTATGDESTGYTYTRKEGRDVFFETICRYAINNGMCPMLWSTPGHVYDRTDCEIENEIEAALYQEMKEYAESCEVFEPKEFNGEYTWTGTISNEGWNPQAPVSGDNCDFVMAQNGGCYSISGIDWSLFTNPVLQLEAGTLSGSVGYQIAKTLNTDNPYWPYIENVDIKGDWSTSSKKTIDLSSLGYSAKESLYIMFTGSDFEGTVTLKIMEKE